MRARARVHTHTHTHTLLSGTRQWPKRTKEWGQWGMVQTVMSSKVHSQQIFKVLSGPNKRGVQQVHDLLLYWTIHLLAWINCTSIKKLISHKDRIMAFVLGVCPGPNLTGHLWCHRSSPHFPSWSNRLAPISPSHQSSYFARTSGEWEQELESQGAWVWILVPHLLAR